MRLVAGFAGHPAGVLHRVDLREPSGFGGALRMTANAQHGGVDLRRLDRRVFRVLGQRTDGRPRSLRSRACPPSSPRQCPRGRSRRFRGRRSAAGGRRSPQSLLRGSGHTLRSSSAQRSGGPQETPRTPQRRERQSGRDVLHPCKDSLRYLTSFRIGACRCRRCGPEWRNSKPRPLLVSAPAIHSYGAGERFVCEPRHSLPGRGGGGGAWKT